MATLPAILDEAARSSADPESARVVLGRLLERDGDRSPLAGPGADRSLGRSVAAVAAASRSLGRLLVADEGALAALRPPSTVESLTAALADAADAAALARAKRLAFLKIAADDLSGESPLEQVGARLSALADAVLSRALCVVGGGDESSAGLAVIAMGKHGAEELNYASDVDVVIVHVDGLDPAVAASRARRVLAIAGEAWRIDTDLRPEGRNGVLSRTLSSYEAYWESWARPWEFQALLKARAACGVPDLGAQFATAAERAVFGQRLDAAALAELRAMKSRAEQLVASRGLADRELKRGRGGIRDIEFAAQLLQLVHGRDDPSLRVRSTLGALGELASAGYIDAGDATVLALAYRLLRTVEHRLQLVEEAQVHTLPPPGAARDHLARVMGFETAAGAGRPRTARFDQVLARYQSSVRSIHERLFFRPLLEAFAGTGALSERAVADRLEAFGFVDAERTRQALAELTRGLTRSSRLMQQLLPVLLGWLAETPDPDGGLLALRTLAGAPHQRDVVVAAFRDSPELARRLCVILGTSRRLGELAHRHPGLALRLGDDKELAPGRDEELPPRAREATGRYLSRAAAGLRSFVAAETLRIAAGDLLGARTPAEVGSGLAALGDAALGAALAAVCPDLPFAVVAMGRYGGAELSYGSDLDVIMVYDGEGPDDAAEAEQFAAALLRVMNGATPSDRIWTTDASLRPEGRQGPLVRSLAAYAAYYEQWAGAWERQALLRARPVAGDPDLAARFCSLRDATVFGRPFTEEDVRETRRLKARTERERIPAGEDPQFHLKLGKGSLADVEWTVQLLQLEHQIASTTTGAALAALVDGGHLDARDGAVLAEALDFLVATRARWHLVGNYVAGAGGPVSAVGSDSLPSSPELLARLARSLGERPSELRERYRRVTRRARAVVERRFYGL